MLSVTVLLSLMVIGISKHADSRWQIDTARYLVQMSTTNPRLTIQYLQYVVQIINILCRQNEGIPSNNHPRAIRIHSPKQSLSPYTCCGFGCEASSGFWTGVGSSQKRVFLSRPRMRP